MMIVKMSENLDCNMSIEEWESWYNNPIVRAQASEISRQKIIKERIVEKQKIIIQEKDIITSKIKTLIGKYKTYKTNSLNNGIGTHYPKIYLLLDNDKIVYIGQTTALWPVRIAGHTDKKFNNIIFIIPDEKIYLEEEKYLIKKYKPKYNKEYKKDELNDRP